MEKEEEVLLTEEEDWRKPCIQYLKDKTLPEDTAQSEKLKRQNFKFYLVNEILYRKGFNENMLCCLGPQEIQDAL